MLRPKGKSLSILKTNTVTEFYSHLITLAHHSVLTHRKKGSTNSQSATRKIGYWELGIGDWGLGIGDWGLGTCTERTRRASRREAVGAASRREVLGIFPLPLHLLENRFMGNSDIE
ncbi:hypothetical protein [Nostoc sp.]|uniref:hypothetical protein n=1 Tax=Nostoc sp. TaxID=1180 RepID=UPI002FF55408